MLITTCQVNHKHKTLKKQYPNGMEGPLSQSKKIQKNKSKVGF